MERRATPRMHTSWPTNVGTGSERPLPPSSVIDVGMSGALLAFSEPVGMTVDEKLILSVRPADEMLHFVASVVRVERGADFRTYVAVRFAEGQDAEMERLSTHLLTTAG